MNDAWIRMNDLWLPRGGRPVLQGITAELGGRAIGLVGANGAGKSTLIGALLGVLRPSRGGIRILDLEIPKQAREIRTRAGVMAEQAGIFPGGSGVEAVAFAGMLNGLPRRESLRRAHRALDALEVGEERYRPTRTFSTGMRQRCKLAMSLVHDPEVLILDEPTVGLDPPGRNHLLELIRGLKDEGRRILLSTHILHDAEFLCDDLLLLESGRVAWSGPLQNLIAGREGRMRAEGEGLGAELAGVLSREGIDAESGRSGEIAFTARHDGDLRRFWQLVAEKNLEVRRLAPEVSALEDVVVAAMETKS